MTATHSSIDPDRERLRMAVDALAGDNRKLLFSDGTVQAFVAVQARDRALASVFLEDLPGNSVREFLRRVREAKPEAPKVNGRGDPAPDGLPLSVQFADELPTQFTALDELVEGLLTVGDSSVWYGDSNAGKTFLLTDVGAAVARVPPRRSPQEMRQARVIGDAYRLREPGSEDE